MKRNIICVLTTIIIIIAYMLFAITQLNKLTVLSFMVVIIIIPLLLLMAGNIVTTIFSKTNFRITVLINIVGALISVMSVFIISHYLIDTSIIDTIINNTSVGENVSVSMSEATAGDNITSVLLYVATAYIASLITYKIKRKLRKNSSSISKK